MLAHDNELSKTNGLNTQRMIINGMKNRLDLVNHLNPFISHILHILTPFHLCLKF